MTASGSMLAAPDPGPAAATGPGPIADPSEPMLAAFAPPPPADRPPEWRYHRGEVADDVLVMIPGQTGEDFELYAPEMQFCEYFDGIIYMPSPVADRHQEWVGFLFALLDGFRCAGRAGQVLTGPAVLRLSDQHKPEPDIFVRPTSQQVAPDGAFPGALAVLVVEVLSPSNRGYDLNFKGSVYRRTGIAEVWCLDGRDRVLVVDRKVGGRYHTEYRTEGMIEPVGIPGFQLDVGWLWQDPLPNWLEKLRGMLPHPA
jgi:Uma2 family endonuclease